ncbi:DsbA family protein [bacterium]|nr:DsbA family protein [bacterium]
MKHRRRFVTALSAVFLSATSLTAAAHETDAAFEERVRTFLMENPEVILDAMTALSEREIQAAQSRAIAAFPELFTDPAALGMGEADAPVRVVEFFDYKCVPCKTMHPGLKKLVDETPDMRIEMRQLPILSPESERGARFALAVKEVAGNEAYARVHDRLWDLRGPLNQGMFGQIALDEGLDWPSVDAAMDSDAVTARIDRNRDIAIALEILGTPAFVTPRTVTFGQSDIPALAEDWLSQ